MKKFLSTSLLYIVLLGGVFLMTNQTAFAACQVIYGGGEICQNQKDVVFTYKLPTPTPAPTQLTVPPTSSLPSTGTSAWGLFLIGLSGVGGVLFLLL